MSIWHLSYVACDRCGGSPAQPGDSADEARRIARTEGYSREGSDDVCGRCNGSINPKTDTPPTTKPWYT